MSRKERRSRNVDSVETASTTQQNTYQPKFTNLKKAVNIIPRNIKQEEYLELLSDPDKHLIVASGSAGSGKTALAMMAGIKALSEKRVDKIVLSRPAVGVEGEDHGFLPGTIYEKMLPWMLPLLDVLDQYYSKKEIESLIENGVISIQPLMYLRGRNLEKSWIIFDEAQNSTRSQMLMLLTRLCEGSKIIITGDPIQKDKQFHRDNGLDDLIDKLSCTKNKMIGLVKFDLSHCVRSKLVKFVLSMYDQ